MRTLISASASAETPTGVAAIAPPKRSLRGHIKANKSLTGAFALQHRVWQSRLLLYALDQVLSQIHLLLIWFRGPLDQQ